jgi:hypothetical protein
VPVEGCAYKDGSFPDPITLPKIDIYFYDDHYFIRPRTDEETERVIYLLRSGVKIPFTDQQYSLIFC